MKIEELLGCSHTVRCLNKAGIETVEQLRKLSEKDLLAIRGVGKVITRDVLAALETVPVHRLFIIAMLDEKTADYCRRLCDLVLPEPLPGFQLRPHITLATLDVLDVDEFIAESRPLFQGMEKVPVRFEEAGFYPNIRSISILPRKDDPLMDLFEKATRIKPEYLEKYYDAGPEGYLPHLTLLHTGHMDEEALKEKGAVIQNHFEPFTGFIEKIEYSLLVGEEQFQII
ncbi:MAG: hypothetical protein J5589_00295 [Firmicutes bacterium]|nr:hypothetical protein [Bacillota bacterium]